MNRKALLAAMAAAAIGIAMLFLYMKRFEDEATGGAPVMVLMATQDIPLGSALTEAMIGQRPLPARFVEERHIRASDVRRVIGIRVSMGIKANESILWSDLATTSEQRRDLSALVRNGMRAITVRAGVNSAFGGLLRPGDRVDVLLTADRPGAGPSSAGDLTDTRVTIPLLQNVIVLAVGRDTGGESLPGAGTRARQGGSATAFNQVTLGVTVQQSQILSLAGDRGLITLTLRNPDDIAVLDGLPETTAADIIDPVRREQVLHRTTVAQPTGGGIERVQ